MATVNNTGTTVTSGVPEAVVPYNGLNKFYVIKNTIDLTGGAMTAGDIYQSLAIPANTLVLTVSMRIDTPAVGTTCTIDIGETDDSAVSWDDGVNGKAAAATYTHALVGTDAGASTTVSPGGKFYGTAQTIDVLMQAITAITAGPKYTLFALCVDMS